MTINIRHYKMAHYCLVLSLIILGCHGIYCHATPEGANGLKIEVVFGETSIPTEDPRYVFTPEYVFYAIATNEGEHPLMVPTSYFEGKPGMVVKGLSRQEVVFGIYDIKIGSHSVLVPASVYNFVVLKKGQKAIVAKYKTFRDDQLDEFKISLLIDRVRGEMYGCWHGNASGTIYLKKATKDPLVSLEEPLLERVVR